MMQQLLQWIHPVHVYLQNKSMTVGKVRLLMENLACVLSGNVSADQATEFLC